MLYGKMKKQDGEKQLIIRAEKSEFIPNGVRKWEEKNTMLFLVNPEEKKSLFL
jgi:hypothetical protein